jgi:dTDP-4-dehydrorhamnose reductase
MKQKLFLFGIGSLTGNKIVSQIKNDYEVYGSYNFRNPNLDFVTSFKLDITNLSKIKDILYDHKPDYIINTCALNNVDYCETHPGEAKKINCDFIENLSKISENINCKIVHLSTDSVFDGNKKTPYIETDIPNPNNVYGHTKLAGEKFALKNSNNVVIRASVLYGYLPENLANTNSSSMKPINFGLWLINKLKSNEEVQILQDEFSSPIIADDFARSIIHLLKENKSGIFHAAPNICINRYEFSKKIAQELDLDSRLIKPVSNKTLGRKVHTGHNKCLDSTKIQISTKFKFLTLSESISLLKNNFN